MAKSQNTLTILNSHIRSPNTIISINFMFDNLKTSFDVIIDTAKYKKRLNLDQENQQQHYLTILN